MVQTGKHHISIVGGETTRRPGMKGVIGIRRESVDATERRAPVMIATRPMMNWRFKPLAIESVGGVAERHPQTQYILSGPNYLLEFQGLVRVMRRCGNVTCEISCMQGMGGVKNLVDEVGAERVLFGTGAVLQYPACNVAKLDHAEIAPEQRQAIYSENALRLLG